MSSCFLSLFFCFVCLSRSLLKADVNEAEEQLVKELESELARVRSDLDSAGQEEHNMNEEEKSIAEEVAQSDTHVRTLRSQMDQLTQEIKQANLQSLSIAPADDLKVLLEGNTVKLCSSVLCLIESRYPLNEWL